MQIINQPFQGQLGNLLTEELKKNYSSLTIFSAFAKNSGVLRLKDAMENFRAKGHSIRAYIGIDLDGTSYEALLNLYSLCNDLYVIHSENFSPPITARFICWKMTIQHGVPLAPIILQEADYGQISRAASFRHFRFPAPGANYRTFMK